MKKRSKNPKKPPPKNSNRRSRAARSPKRQTVRPRRVPVVEAEVVEVVPAVLSAADTGPESALVMDTPELGFASRVPPEGPERPFPASRRAIFYDVENASRPEHIVRVIDHLAVDRAGRRTDFVAVGNWRVIGHDTARLLARHGANLVHSAPSTGVRDWSDLRIAVAAGVWLAGARPGDVLEVITNDRAFDAVGDVAASLGIAFRRLSHQGLTGAAAEAPAPVREVLADSRSNRRGRGRRRGGWRDRPAPAAHEPARHPAPVAHEPVRHPAPAVHEPARPEPLPIPEPAEVPAAAPEVAEAPPHTAPHDEIIAVVRDLLQRSPSRPVTLDSLANALKARGFSRPPGSPRLITRLRRIKEISLSRSGVITLLGAGGAEPPSEARTAVESRPEPEPEVEIAPPEVVAEESTAPEPKAAEYDDEDEGPGPGNEALPPGQAQRPMPPPRWRRRPRRGGRGPQPQPQRARMV